MRSIWVHTHRLPEPPEAKPLRFRRLNRAWAWFRGYFWLPCPRCGKMFGGHEIGTGRLVRHSGRISCTCPECPLIYEAGDWTHIR